MRKLLAVLSAAALSLLVASWWPVEADQTCRVPQLGASGLSPSQRCVIHDPCAGTCDSSSEVLKDGLISYWNLDEASGTRADSASAANTLTLFGAPVLVAGVVNSGAFVDTNNQLRHADNASLSVGATSFSFSVWANRPVSSLNRTVLTRTDGVNFDYQLFVQIGGQAVWQVSDGVNFSTATTTNAVTTGAWAHIVATFDTTDLKARVYLNNGTVAVGAALPGALSDTNQEFRIGNTGAISVDEVAFYKRVLPPAVVPLLFNGGQANPWPF